MTTTFLAPDPINSTQFIPGSNTPANGGQLFFYANLSSTKQTVYRDPAAATAWSNPIVLDSGGNLPSGGEVWFTQGQTYTVVFAPANDTDPPGSPYWTKDNLSGINDVTTSASQWITGPTPTFVSTTSFTLVGDQTTTFTAGRVIQTTNTGGTVYSEIVRSAFSAGLTTVTVVNRSGTLDSGLSAVFYSIIDGANPGITATEVFRDGGTVASASTTNIWGVPGNSIHISGTNTIASFSTAAYAGMQRSIIFDGALTLVHSSNVLNLPGNANVTTGVGDRIQVLASTASAAVVLQYQRAAVAPAAATQSSSTVFAGPSSGAAAAPAFRSLVGAESALTLIDAQVFNGSTSWIAMTTGIDSSYDAYRLVIANAVPISNNVDMWLRVSLDAGVSWVSTASLYNHALQQFSSGGATVTVTGGTNQLSLSSSAAISNTTTPGQFSATVDFFRPSQAVQKKVVKVQSGYHDSGGATRDVWGTVVYNSSAAFNGLQLLASSGNISTGAVYLYGMRKA